MIVPNFNKVKVIFIKMFCVLLFLPILVTASDSIPEPDDYKMDEYRSPTPETLSGVTVVDAIQAKAMHENGQAIFIDVLPSPKQPPGMKEGDIWLPKKRLNIPGSIWLADVGYGVLSDDLEMYFISNLELVSKDKTHGLLFYCQINCWMSWNAAKRALNFGYSNVFWFPGGVDEWLSEGFLLEASTAVELNR